MSLDRYRCRCEREPDVYGDSYDSEDVDRAHTALVDFIDNLQHDIDDLLIIDNVKVLRIALAEIKRDAIAVLERSA